MPQQAEVLQQAEAPPQAEAVVVMAGGVGRALSSLRPAGLAVAVRRVAEGERVALGAAAKGLVDRVAAPALVHAERQVTRRVALEPVESDAIIRHFDVRTHHHL